MGCGVRAPRGVQGSRLEPGYDLAGDGWGRGGGTIWTCWTVGSPGSGPEAAECGRCWARGGRCGHRLGLFTPEPRGPVPPSGPGGHVATLRPRFPQMLCAHVSAAGCPRLLVITRGERELFPPSLPLPEKKVGSSSPHPRLRTPKHGAPPDGGPLLGQD